MNFQSEMLNPYFHRGNVVKRGYLEDYLESRYNIDLPVNKSVYLGSLSAGRRFTGSSSVIPPQIERCFYASFIRNKTTKRVTQLILNFLVVVYPVSSNLRKLPATIMNSKFQLEAEFPFEINTFMDTGYVSDSYIYMRNQNSKSEYKNTFRGIPYIDKQYASCGTYLISASVLSRYEWLFKYSPEWFFRFMTSKSADRRRYFATRRRKRGPCQWSNIHTVLREGSGKPRVPLPQMVNHYKRKQLAYTAGVQCLYKKQNVYAWVRPRYRAIKPPTRELVGLSKRFVESILRQRTGAT